MKTNTDIRMITIEEAARHIAVSTRTVRRWIQAGDLAAHRFGRQWRIARNDLSSFLNQHRQG